MHGASLRELQAKTYGAIVITGQYATSYEAQPDVVFLHLSQQEADKERSLRSLLIQFWVEMC